jgi:hypothetical protein
MIKNKYLLNDNFNLVQYLVGCLLTGCDVPQELFDRMVEASEVMDKTMHTLRHRAGNKRSDVEASNGQSALRTAVSCEFQTEGEKGKPAPLPGKVKLPIKRLAAAVYLQAGHCFDGAYISAFYTKKMFPERNIYLTGLKDIDQAYAEEELTINGKTYKIIIDGWRSAGNMPVLQEHYYYKDDEKAYRFAVNKNSFEFLNKNISNLNINGESKKCIDDKMKKTLEEGFIVPWTPIMDDDPAEFSALDQVFLCVALAKARTDTQALADACRKVAALCGYPERAENFTDKIRESVQNDKFLIFEKPEIKEERVAEKIFDITYFDEWYPEFASQTIEVKSFEQAFIDIANESERSRRERENIRINALSDIVPEDKKGFLARFSEKYLTVGCCMGR